MRDSRLAAHSPEGRQLDIPLAHVGKTDDQHLQCRYHKLEEEHQRRASMTAWRLD